jgi:hypothetical protein
MRSWRLRRWPRVVAVLLLVATARLPHTDQDDDACATLFAGGSSQDGSALIDGSGTPSQPDHCAICHWTRLLRSPLTVVGVTVASVGPATVVARRALPLHVNPVNEHVPARAPPSTLL